MAHDYGQIDEKKLKKLHEVEKEILDKVANICYKNNINFQLTGGTLLGAVRHKGFIPWDDDIDITMFRKDYDKLTYDKFLNIAPKELGDNYYLQCYETDENCYFPFAKIRKRDTLFDEKEISHLDCPKGIYIDVFPFETISKPDSKILRFKAMLIKNIWDTIFVKKGIHAIKDTRHPFLDKLLSIFSYKFLRNWQLYLMKSVNIKNGDYLVCLCGAYDYKKDIHRLDKMVPFSKINFEGTVYPTYKIPDHYLTNLYGGDYMKLPPKEKRVNHVPERIVFNKMEDEK